MVRMIVREKLHIDAADRHLELIEPDGRTAAGVDQEFLIAGLDQRRGAEPVGARDRHAGPEQGYAEVACRHGSILWVDLMGRSYGSILWIDLDVGVLDHLGPA